MNGNKGYPDMKTAWEACRKLQYGEKGFWGERLENTDNCKYIMKDTDGKYYLRKDNDKYDKNRDLQYAIFKCPGML